MKFYELICDIDEITPAVKFGRLIAIYERIFETHKNICPQTFFNKMMQYSVKALSKYKIFVHQWMLNDELKELFNIANEIEKNTNFPLKWNFVEQNEIILAYYQTWGFLNKMKTNYK